MERLDTTTAVDTPEAVRFRLRLAGPGQRGAAWAVDVVLQVIAASAVVLLASMLSAGGEVLAGAGWGVGLVVLFVLSWFYGAAFEWAMAGQTPGKWVLGLRVVRSDGAPVGFRDAVLRNLARGVDGLPFGYVVGVFVTLVDPRMRRVGDLIADTVVVQEQRTGLLDVVDLDPPVTEEERQGLPVAVHLSRPERRAIEALLRRQRQLSPARVEELAGYLGPTLADRTGVEAPSWLRTLALAWARSTGRDR